MADPTRDVLAELDSIEAYLNGLIGDDPLPGQDSNKQHLGPEFLGVRTLAQNVIELAAAYSSGVTHKDRLEKSMGQSLTDAQVAHLVPGIDASAYANAQEQIADLQRQLAAAKGGNTDG
jgi:hypothetical protein